MLPSHYHDWIISEREHFRTLYIGALLQIIHYERSQSEFELACEFSQKILRIDPSNEQAHQQLMFSYVEMGNRQAALDQYLICEKALRAELAVAPATETTGLHNWIKSNSELSRNAGAVTNLPIPLSSFVGRAKERSDLVELIGTSRLVTIVGAGGCGKTRLALRVATNLLDSFKDGIWWVELAPIVNERQIITAIAKAAGIHESSDQLLQETLEGFFRKKRVLIVLDNCEHVLSGCSKIGARLLSNCAELKVLATSREAFNIPGEQIYPVPSLTAPGAGDSSVPGHIMQFEAVRLFVERASAVRKGFEVTNENAQDVALICRRLDGIPLAIELAAALVKLLTPAQLAKRLDNRFDLLTNGSRIALPRHQTLRAAIDWSYDPLTESSKLLLGRLSVFAGGFSLNAAVSVCSDEQLNSSSVLLELSRLVDQSLVQASLQGQNERFRMLETIRQYADEKLFASDEKDRLRTRHLEYFSRMAEDLEPMLTSPSREACLGQLDAEYDDLDSALTWALESGRLRELSRMAANLAWFWNLRGYQSQRLSWLANKSPEAKFANSAGEIVDRARALYGEALIANTQGAHIKAKELAEESVQLLRQTGDATKHRLGLSLTLLGSTKRALGTPKLARKSSEEAVSIFREKKDQWGLANALSGLALVARDLEDFELARFLIEESVDLWRLMADRRGLAEAIHSLGIIDYRAGRYAEASSSFSEAARIRRELADSASASYSLQNLGIMMLNLGDDHRAQSLFEENEILARELGMKGNLAISLHYYGYLAMFSGNLGAAEAFFRQSLAISQEWGPKWLSGMDIAGLGGVAGARGKHERAAQLWGAGEERMKTVASFMDAADRRFYEHTLAKSREWLGEEVYLAVLARGHQMDFGEAIELALKSVE